MKTNLILLFSAAFLSLILFMGNGSGAGAAGNGNRTGSPGSSTCSFCHGGGSFAPIVTIDVKNSQGASVTTVDGDSVYTISVSIAATSGSPSRYGFQAGIFNDSSNLTVGTLINQPTGVRYQNVGSNTMAEHSSASVGSSFTYSWRAPASLTGNSAGSITLYAYGNATNGNSATSGDAAAGDTYQLTLNPAPVAVKETELAATVRLNLFPNPVVNELTLSLDSKTAGQYNIRIFNNAGQALQQQSLQANEGQNQLSINVADLSGGVYRLILEDENGRSMTQSFVKF